MNHKKMYRQVYGCGQLLDAFEKSNLNMHSPTPEEYDALPKDIKVNYPKYMDYKNAVDSNNAVTRQAMVSKLQDQKENYKSFTNSDDTEKGDFDSEADLLIAELEESRIRFK